MTEERPGEYRCRRPGQPRQMAALAPWLDDQDLPLTELRAGRSLEEVYLGVTGDGRRRPRPSPDPGRADRRTRPSPHAAAPARPVRPLVAQPGPR